MATTSKSMASPALPLLAMVLMLAASALAQAPAPAPPPTPTTTVAPSPSQAFCPPSFDTLQAFQKEAAQHGDQMLFAYFPLFGSSASITSKMTGILSQNPTWKLCVCFPNPFFILGLTGPEVTCAYYVGSVSV
ncbi:hypothetical protein SEVIR_2G089700v4 [Setaria viridis]|uniref:Uncharacterized protein n=1 Tax=Setaria viridis TaxID=4556 RepID=A0A4U6VQT4_SETVI|nr:hypothetical protein SEVIR_2G089700v2 [Setaria viridis]